MLVKESFIHIQSKGKNYKCSFQKTSIIESVKHKRKLLNYFYGVY